jgi:hypothetical protein
VCEHIDELIIKAAATGVPLRQVQVRATVARRVTA